MDPRTTAISSLDSRGWERPEDMDPRAHSDFLDGEVVPMDNDVH